MKTKTMSLTKMKNLFNALMISSLVAFGAHLYLTIQHYSLKAGEAAGPSICDINSKFNCGAVATSEYSEVLGIPVALLGLIAQLIILTFLTAARFELSAHSESLKKSIFFFSIFIALISVVMGSISTFALGTYCLFCIAAYLLSFISLFLSHQLFKTAAPGSDVFSPRWSLGMIILAPGFAWMVNSITNQNYGLDKLDSIIADSISEWRSNPRYDFSTSDGLIKGDPSSAKMVIVEFADFLCPHCKVASPILEKFAESNPQEVALIFKVFPLDGSCNAAIQMKSNGLRCKLAALPICAQDMAQKGWNAHHWIFDGQERLSQTKDLDGELQQLSTAEGLSYDEIKTCISSDQTQERILKMAAEGGQAKIHGTPAVFVNGKELPRGQALPVLNAVLKSIKQN